MFTTAACLVALYLPPVPQQEKLSISDVRFTYGYLGATRSDTTFLPGEKVFLAYNVRNMKVNANGKCTFSVFMEVLSPKGDVLLKQTPTNQVAINFLGGNIMPAAGSGDIPLDLPPGKYTIKVTVIDKSTNEQATLEVHPTVAKAQFGIIHVEPSADSTGRVPTSALAVLGESIFVNFALVGFERDKSTKQPNVKVSMKVTDENGKETMPQPLTGEAKEGVPEEIKILPLQFSLTANRVGRFNIELTAQDMITGATSRVTFPIYVSQIEQSSEK